MKKKAYTTRLDQQANLKSNKLITFDGKTLHEAEWGRRVGINISTLRNRIIRGWPLERALKIPARAYGEQLAK